MARRNWSASAARSPRSRPPVCINCSWNSGTPRVFRAPLHRRVVVGDRIQPVAPPDVGVHGAALDGPRPDQRDLDHQVVERPRLQPRQRRHLRPRLHLEHPDRVGALQHLVHRRLRTGPAGRGPPRRPCARRPGRSGSAGPRACRAPAGRTSPAPTPRSHLCPTAARCGSPSAPIRPGTRRRSAGRRSPCRRSGCRGAAGSPRSAAASSSTGSGISVHVGRSATLFHRLTCLLQASCWPCENPSARGHVPHRTCPGR